jgi:hypothetical protein
MVVGTAAGTDANTITVTSANGGPGAIASATVTVAAASVSVPHVGAGLGLPWVTAPLTVLLGAILLLGAAWRPYRGIRRRR